MWLGFAFQDPQGNFPTSEPRSRCLEGDPNNSITRQQGERHRFPKLSPFAQLRDQHERGPSQSYNKWKGNRFKVAHQFALKHRQWGGATYTNTRWCCQRSRHLPVGHRNHDVQGGSSKELTKRKIQENSTIAPIPISLWLRFSTKSRHNEEVSHEPNQDAINLHSHVIKAHLWVSLKTRWRFNAVFG